MRRKECWLANASGGDGQELRLTNLWQNKIVYDSFVQCPIMEQRVALLSASVSTLFVHTSMKRGSFSRLCSGMSC